jgi:hypothetical protein
VRPHAAAVSQHRHAIAELEHLVEAVGHEDDAAPLRNELARRSEHALDLRLAERRGRLVEDQQARVAHEETSDLDELPLADREGLDERSKLHVREAELVEDTARMLREAAPAVEEGHVEPTEEDVVLDAELRDEAELLVHERDPVRLRVERVPERQLDAVEADDPLVRPHEPDEGLHEGALAGAVVPADGVHLADPDVERELADGAHRPVGLREPDHLQEHGRSGIAGRTRMGSGRGHRIPFSVHQLGPVAARRCRPS